MKKTKSALVSAAVAGLLLGGVSTTLTSCKSGSNMEASIEKHACKGLNSCKNQGGCKAGDNTCKGVNECKTKGGCATVAHHDCGGKNSCKGQGGCKTTTNSCAGKNECAKKGGCAVPVKQH